MPRIADLAPIAGPILGRMAALASVALVCVVGTILSAGASRAQYFALGKGSAPLEPYNVDYSQLADPAARVSLADKLHFVPIGQTGAYVTFDGELREEAFFNNGSYGLRTPLRNTYDLQRLIGSAYLHLDDHLATFVQIGRFDSFARINPSTTDRDEGRIQQGFIELKEKAGSTDLMVRGGRQEITLGSGRFVWVNDSSNVRTTHDGVRAQAIFDGNVTLDVLYTRPVTPVLDAFDDFDEHSGAFAAAYLSETVRPDTHVDEYYFFRRNIGGQYSGLTGNEDRSTVGGRLWGAIGPVLYDGDFAYQFGSFSGREISALGTSIRALYTIPQAAWDPGIQLQASYFSGGGGTNTQTIRTFSAPFPRPTLLNFIGLDTLENLVEAYPAFVLNPTRNLALRLGPEFVWRASVDDAVYISRTTPLTATMSAKDRASFIGTNLIATAVWNPAPKVKVFAEYLHELPGPAILLAGGRGVDAGVLQATLDF